jgi:ABC-type branched-subunit amino acid transport system substrate-binding protein
MSQSRKRAVIVVAAATIVVAGCSSSSSGNGGNTGGGSTVAPSGSSGPSGTAKSIDVTVGVLTDLTGPAASGNKTTGDGVKAGVVYAARNGVNVKYVVGDSATNPATTLSVVQKFVTQDHVNVVIANSSLTFAASNYLTAKNVPVIGAAEDGPEWITAKNMFSVYGPVDTTKVTDTLGGFFKAQGVTTVGAIGYSISPSSSEAAKASIKSAESVGLKSGYLNSSFPFGSTDVQPVALAMKSAGVDGITAATDPNTAFSLITALRQSGANVKVAILATGYGGDLLQAGPGALSEAQNVYFSLGFEPIEMQTAATKQFASDLQAAGVSGQATSAQYNGYTAVGLLVRALKATAGNKDSATLISTLSNIHDWDALGLFGSHKLDLSDRTNAASGVDNCLWVTKLEGSTFKLVSGADPVCGKTLAGVKVSAST